MSNNGINNATYVSALTNTAVGGGSATDIMSYVEMLLVQDYDQQLKDIAQSIKVNNKLKEAYRNHKVKLNDLLGKEKVGDDKNQVELTAEELSWLESKPEYTFDGTVNDGIGKVVTHYTNDLAVNEYTDLEGDPHFSDADGTAVGFGSTDWDFQGVAGHEYLYFQDANITMTATHQAWGDSATVVGSVNFTIKGEGGETTLSFAAGQTPLLDGQAMQIGMSYTTADGGTATWDGTNLTVTTSEGYTFTMANRGTYLEGQLTSGANGVLSDGVAPIGILGEQFDSDNNTDAVDGTKYDLANPTYNESTTKVYIEDIKTEIERLQMRLDGLNSETELAQTDLSTITSQRKLAFETLSSMISKVSEAASTVVRNIK